MSDESADVVTLFESIAGADLVRKLFILEDGMKGLPSDEQLDFPKTHYFANKLYGREIFIPKGSVIIGKLHRFSQLNVMLSGDITVTTDEGMRRISETTVIPSSAGTKRAGYAHEDTRWLTICGTEETDPDKTDEVLTIATYQEYLDFADKLLIKGG